MQAEVAMDGILQTMAKRAEGVYRYEIIYAGVYYTSNKKLSEIERTETIRLAVIYK